MSKSALKILNTAEQLFNTQSFHAVGVDLIRDESGCSKTTLYTYYKTKNQLIHAVLKARDQRFQQDLLTAIAMHSGQNAILKIFDWHMHWFQQDHFKGCLFVRVIAESDGQDDVLIELSQAHKNWIKQLILKHCPTRPTTNHSEIIYTLLEGLISRFLVEGFNLEIASTIRSAIQQLLQSTDVASSKS